MDPYNASPRAIKTIGTLEDAIDSAWHSDDPAAIRQCPKNAVLPYGYVSLDWKVQFLISKIAGYLPAYHARSQMYDGLMSKLDGKLAFS
jgi:hypothetical protein